MKQLFQDLRDGRVSLLEVPCPAVTPGKLLIQGECSLISAGTERMLLDFGRGSWLQKIRSQPDKVRQVRQKIKSEGLAATLQAVRRKLAAPISLGYCHAGRVLAVGEGVVGFQVGDRVLSNGPHAELVSVPALLCAKIPQGLDSDEAVFGVLGAIALQGQRLMAPSLGESVVVLGLGLIGQLAVQLLLAQGCRVLAVDLDPSKVTLAEGWGAEGFTVPAGGDPLFAAQRFSQGRGVDGVLITAATKSNAPLIQAAEMCRQRGRIVLVGVVEIQAPRDLFYKKELSFQVSCSYGPGRYDPAYEEGGQDYPFGLVRWTQQRNFEAVLELMAARKLRCGTLRSARFPFQEAPTAYDHLGSCRDALGILLDYPSQVSQADSIPITSPKPFQGTEDSIQNPGLAIIGAGAFATAVLMPELAKTQVRPVAVMSRQGASAAQAAQRFGFQRATSRLEDVLEDPTIQAVLIATRHNTHAGLVAKALLAGKHVFVEKPLATDQRGLELVRNALANRSDLTLTVGFNRRFAPLMVQLKSLLTGRQKPLHMICEINAGALPSDHWTLGQEGGGRLVGEGCHFIDLMRHVVGAPISGVSAHRLGLNGPKGDAFTLQVTFQDGSLGTLIYASEGSPTYPKETYTLHWEGRSARLTQFRRLEAWGIPKFTARRAWSPDKGHGNLIAAWIEGLGMREPISREELFEVAEWTLRAQETLA